LGDRPRALTAEACADQAEPTASLRLIRHGDEERADTVACQATARTRNFAAGAAGSASDPMPPQHRELPGMRSGDRASTGTSASPEPACARLLEGGTDAIHSCLLTSNVLDNLY
jgi:hypothetical protein